MWRHQNDCLFENYRRISKVATPVSEKNNLLVILQSNDPPENSDHLTVATSLMKTTLSCEWTVVYSIRNVIVENKVYYNQNMIEKYSIKWSLWLWICKWHNVFIVSVEECSQIIRYRQSNQKHLIGVSIPQKLLCKLRVFFNILHFYWHTNKQMHWILIITKSMQTIYLINFISTHTKRTLLQ